LPLLTLSRSGDVESILREAFLIYSLFRLDELLFKNRSYFSSLLFLLYLQHDKKILAQNTKKEKPLERACSCKISIPIFTGPGGPDKLWICIKAPG